MIRSFRVVDLLAMILLSMPAMAQTTSLGIKGGYLYLWNTSTIPVIAGSTECGTFSDGTSNGYLGGLTIEHGILGDMLELSGSVIYAMRPATLVTTSQDNFEVLDPNTNTYVNLVREHVFNADLGYVSVEVGLRSRPIASLPIYVRVVADAGNPLVSAAYTQTEEIIEPSGVLFPDGTQHRTTGSGDFPGMGTSYGVSGGIGAAFAVSKRVEICPEVSYRYGLNSLTNQAEWKQSWAAATLQVRYRFFDDEPAPAPPPPPPPPPPPVVESAPVVEPPPVMIASISSQPLEIRETIVTQTFPLLPYVFFDSSSATLPPKYTSNTTPNAFNEQTLPKQTLPIYYAMLDVIGKRMTSSTSKLTITGTTDGIERKTPAERRTLAEQRARTIASQLQTRWGIKADRFEIRTVDRPVLASNEMYAEGVEENRRVELSSTDASLLAPVVHSRFNEYVPVQPVHDIAVTVRHPEVAARWSLDVAHQGRTVGERTGAASPPSSITFKLDQEMTDRLGPVVGAVDTLRARMVIDQQGGAPAEATTSFPLKKTVSNYEVSRLSLIVFDYDRSEISSTNQEMMKSVIASSVREGSTATIVGSTDRLGEMQHNLELSTDRAKAVDNFARRIAPALNVKEVKGVGPNILPYDNTLPEGRYYCRTVSLTITTPLR